MSRLAPSADAGRGSSRSASAPDRPRFSEDYREADRALVKILREDGFQGRQQEAVEKRLVEYAFQLLRHWMRTGEIFNRSEAAGRPVPMDPVARDRLQSSFEERDELVADTVLAALTLFRKQLKNDRWDPEKGALTTYFIGAAVLSFPNVYRAWVRRSAIDARVAPMGVTPEDLSPLDIPHAEDDVARLVEENETVANFFKKLKSPDREVAQMLYEGKTTTEIAEHFNVNPAAIRQRLRRLKATAAGLT
ncbi:sigma-70 family RNA polymerase sigma factor [Streptomyces sp. NPDC056501]|uniref:sigma-70 family RNA polymerase sigma factor n=1 Tax=Streptomyces sp. NPDC056501 TaxID=3345841 RepID=UPI003674E399